MGGVAPARNKFRSWSNSTANYRAHKIDSQKLIILNINGNQRSFDEAGLNIAQLVQQLGLQGKRLAIERNGEIVPRSIFDETQLASGDKLEIVGAVGGG
jgi:sulfur carrier protein